MELTLDFNKLKQIIDVMPEGDNFLKSKTKGFKYLYETVYRVLLGKDTEYVKLDVDIDSFDFDDLIDFEEFITEKCRKSERDPVFLLDKIIGRLPPAIKATAFM
ncbi:MAG: hypothetical protein FWD48_04065 [Oscillospiraceae bacterium]|nr:hypothetical protein [Oscillospiraceae bacterium]